MGVFGLEGELFGFGGRLNQRIAGVSGAVASLASVNSMVNLLVRYPGSVIQPYIGVGGGVSLGYLDATSIQSGLVEIRGKSDDVTLAFQLIGGLRAYVSDKVYLFGEYKYFGTKYSWPSEGAGDPETSLSFRAHIVAAGFGVSF
jgi:opacity protein-like surface antigen